ncbi:hypothetical protein RHI9324_00615 [Rhizobium sp. CECT 9324]|jgi:hypothetical protein|nr:hypothetical protein RHI9324_00615 [Rhizobium sp. CECT 9324]
MVYLAHQGSATSCALGKFWFCNSVIGLEGEEPSAMQPDPDELTPEEARRDHWEMLRFLAINAAFGAVLGLVTAGAILWLDLGGVGTSLGRASHPILPVLMMIIPFALTFAAAVTASAVMLMPYKKKKQR